MGLLDVLFGRSKQKPARRDALFELLTAYVTLEARHNIRSAGRAGVCVRPVSSSFFQTLEGEVRDLLKVSSEATASEVKVLDDSYSYRWIVLEDPDFEDLVTVIHGVSDLVVDHGFSDRLLAAAFRFRRDSQDIYLVYNYRRGTFYPFVPLPGRNARDNQEELRLSSLLENELTMEKQLDQWYALWGLPV